MARVANGFSFFFQILLNFFFKRETTFVANLNIDIMQGKSRRFYMKFALFAIAFKFCASNGTTNPPVHLTKQRSQTQIGQTLPTVQPVITSWQDFSELHAFGNQTETTGFRSAFQAKHVIDTPRVSQLLAERIVARSCHAHWYATAVSQISHPC
jgi:hypothetical protein